MIIRSPLNITTNSTDGNGDVSFTTYQFSFCQPLKAACNYSMNPAAAECGQPSVAGVCQQTQTNNLLESACDGRFENVMYETVSDNLGTALSVSYHQGDICAEWYVTVRSSFLFQANVLSRYSQPKNVYTVINVYCDAGAAVPVVFDAKREDPVRSHILGFSWPSCASNIKMFLCSRHQR